jgi:hypothetical protein
MALRLLMAIDLPRLWDLQLALQHVQEPRQALCCDPLQAPDLLSTSF